MIDDVARYFTRSDGTYLFARWGRPIAPVAFGIEDETLTVLKDAIGSVCHLAGHEMTDVDPELGSNLMVFFCRTWEELLEVPNLERMITELADLVPRLIEAGANQYRTFRFDTDGGIKACFVFLRMDEVMQDIPADTLCLGQAALSMLLWSDEAFLGVSPLALTGDNLAILKPEVAAIIRSSYDPVMPVVSTDPSHALRLQARVSQLSEN